MKWLVFPITFHMLVVITIDSAGHNTAQLFNVAMLTEQLGAVP